MTNDYSNDQNNRQKKVHIAHLTYSFRVGGLENGMVNLINTLPTDRYHHTIICLSGYDQDFFNRIQTENVDITNLNKKPGNDLGMHFRLIKLLRKLRPDISHSRNTAALECQLAAFIAGVPYRIHGEHGWDHASFLQQKRHILIKKMLRPIIHLYVALSKEGRAYLTDTIGISGKYINHICNGVDVNKFTSNSGSTSFLPKNWNLDSDIIFGCVGRMADVKNHHLLADAFISLCRDIPNGSDRLRLIIIGDGINRAGVVDKLEKVGLSDQIWIPGSREDIAAILPTFNVFILPSLAEGISNTILEAMASGLPVIATNVGGNPELVECGHSGTIVPSNDAEAMANAMSTYVTVPDLVKKHGNYARKRAETVFSIESMVNRYDSLYQKAV
ncbi:MAG: TIGR03088 family PEP-CTERM/XrtA system glycosyltransferase [Motiliproteus sp.]|nr:TIGR03088 family PEP-CTERM/XrtA system glycosyltransferase [Motiliproteus sp.]MCW9052391.1 TIGR03088 family PEP-CTERM/XrtA system glycosyltransferase [Motiliproteus sp.]